MKRFILFFIISFNVINITACDKVKEIISYQQENPTDKNVIIRRKDESQINGKRVALLIANQDYITQNSLQNPINDLKLLKSKLIDLGYQVEELTNAKEKQMSRAIEEFGKNAKNADSAIFYYSGHGMQDDARRNFLIPVDAEINSNADIESDGVEAYKVIDALKKAKPRLSLVLFDACRNNPLDDVKGYSFTRGGNSFSNKDYDIGRNKLLISYATQTGYSALDGEGKNSPYAIAVARQLTQAKDKSLLMMFDDVADEVLTQTNEKQNPTRVNKNVKVKTKLFSSKDKTTVTPVKKETEKTETTKTKVEEKKNIKLIPFTKNGKWGFISKQGEVIPLQYDWASDFSEDLASVKKEGNYGFINKQGEVVIPLQYDYASSFSEGLAVVMPKKDDKWGFINKQGEVVIPFQYDKAYNFSEGLATVAIKKDGKWGFINKQNEVIIPLKYDYASSFSEGLARVENNDKSGFINKQGEIVIPLQYDEAGEFTYGLVWIKKDNKYGFINKQGEVVIPIQYDKVYSFSFGTATVEKDGEKFHINKQGKRVD